MKRLPATICLTIAVLLGSAGVSASGDFQKSGEFEATLTYASGGWDLYEVNLSTLPDLNWITTIGCLELLIMDDVIIEIWKSKKQGIVVGGFFYVINEDEPKGEWDSCQISGFHKYRPRN